ncbi:MAG: SDR family oxidoreductase [Candidatus Latescibacteria bacterium]|nr:SDR family oxidoreductase [Candidatus Latescibacterota bacterium]
MHPLFDLTGRVAVVSGAARGMGRAIATGLAEVGADLLLADLDLEGAQRTAAELAQLGHRALAQQCDMSDPEQVRALFARLDREFGQIDVLANVAGEGVLCAPEDLTLEQVQYALQQLVVGRFCACQEAGRRMLQKGRGSIINFGSLASITALGRGHTAYSMAMGGVAQMTRELSTEWAGRGVRVNAILPAQVVNPGLEQRMEADPQLRRTYLRGIPTGRLGDPDDVRGVAIFLASDAARWVTGVLLPMDGGNLAMNAGGTYPGSPALP